MQHLNHNNTASSVDEDSCRSGELVPCSPHLLHNSVPSGHNSTDTQDRHSNRSCDPGSCDPYDSTLSYEDTGGVHSGRHRKRRRRTHGKEQTTKDQATNTDLSSNGMFLSRYIFLVLCKPNGLCQQKRLEYNLSFLVNT